ncbi:MAG: GTP cyclohydrolase II [Deltaproteobacteria bacterium]|nr:GTP cyclohydrolase II [Deltaproteobacteria bacterium]
MSSQMRGIARPVGFNRERPAPEGPAARIEASAELPTEHGDFRIHVFSNAFDGEEHLALVHGEIDPEAVTPVRIHSECLTGDALSSLRCDCRAQLLHAQGALGASPSGVLLYLRQEGRGIGLGAKIAAYALQDQGFDTVEANEHLGFDADLRDYRVAAEMLRALGVGRVRLFTNNLAKVFGLKRHGIEVVEREAIQVGRRPENERYLDTKRDRCGHLL